jgi:hypothetical protein
MNLGTIPSLSVKQQSGVPVTCEPKLREIHQLVRRRYRGLLDSARVEGPDICSINWSHICRSAQVEGFIGLSKCKAS